MFYSGGTPELFACNKINRKEKNRRILNTNLGKTARFYAVGKFYVPGSSGDYSGLAIGGTAWSNIVGVQYVSATDYKHYYTFPKGTYLVNINLFANLEASTSNVLGVALNIEVDDKAIANPWFRMIKAFLILLSSVEVSSKSPCTQERQLKL